MDKKIIFSIVAIIIILIIAFLSQQGYIGTFGQDLISNAKSQAGAYLTKGVSWAISGIYPKVVEEVQNRGEVIKNELNQEKQKVTEDIGKKIQNYFTGISNSILHPGENNNCPTPPTQPPTDQ